MALHISLDTTESPTDLEVERPLGHNATYKLKDNWVEKNKNYSGTSRNFFRVVTKKLKLYKIG